MATPRLTAEAAQFLIDLLNVQDVKVGHPDFDHTVRLIQEARTFLTSIAVTTPPAPAEKSDTSTTNHKPSAAPRPRPPRAASP